MSTISVGDDPSAAVEGLGSLTEAGLDAVISRMTQDKDAPTVEPAALSKDELIPALLEKVPADLRDTVTIQIGATKVLKPGGEQNLSDKHADTLRALLSDPSQTNGTIKAYDDQGQTFMKVVGGVTQFDHLEILPTVQAQTVEHVSEQSLRDQLGATEERIAELKDEWSDRMSGAGGDPNEIDAQIDLLQDKAADLRVQLGITPDPTAVNFDFLAQSAQTPEQKLLDTIARLETRVGELEAKLNPVKLATPNVSNWMNGIRDGIASKMRQTTDAISQRVNSLADRIAVKTDAVSQTISATVSEVRENVTDSARLAVDVTNAAVTNVLDAGMQRHSEAVQSVNHAAAELVSGIKSAMDDPRQAYLDKVALPTAAAMMRAAEQVPGRVQVDEAGNKTLNVGTHELRQSADGKMSLSRAGQNVTAESLQTADVQLIGEMKQVIEPHAQKIEPPKIELPKVKMSV